MATRLIEINGIMKDVAAKLGREKCRRAPSFPSRPAGTLFGILSLTPGAPAFLVFLTRALAKIGFEYPVLYFARLGAPRDDDRARLPWELAKSILRGQNAKELHSRSSREDKELLSALDAASRSREARIREPAQIALAEGLFYTGQYQRAVGAAEQALAHLPGRMRLLRIKANSLIALRRFDEGQAVYAEMLAHEPAAASLTRTLQLIEPLCRRQAAAIQPLTARASLLVAVGGGIGDMLHATPAIRNIARRTGERVDVIALGDHPGSEFLLNNSDYVSRVVAPSQGLIDTRYKTVLLTHSAGSIRLPFSAGRIFDSREWCTFRPGMMHETIFNLEAAKRLLDVDYSDDDTTEYFAGDLKHQPLTSTLVGIHAGSKSGRWVSKRWPYFAELAAQLSTRGVRVASFGTADEYVAGTEDRTGGTIEEMSRSMLDCTHFVSNDSGPMHIASALGIPVLALFAPTDPMTHLPLRRTTVALALEKRCAPCEIKNHRYFASGQCRCIADIGSGEVAEKIFSLIESSPATPRPTHGGMDARSQNEGIGW